MLIHALCLSCCVCLCVVCMYRSCEGYQPLRSQGEDGIMLQYRQQERSYGVLKQSLLVELTVRSCYF